MTKRFKAVYSDEDYDAWCTIREEWADEDGYREIRYAEFHGNNAQKYAREHARRLNEKERK